MSRKPKFARNERAVHCLPEEEESPDFSLVERKKTPTYVNAIAVGEKFGAHELVWEIRRDALSITYAARSEGVDRLLALRIFSERLTDAAQVRSIQRAAQKAAELTHANLVSVYENGLSSYGAPYLVTDLVEGDTLTDVLQVSKRLDIARFLDIFNQSCDALMEAHAHQLIHGNLSPNKIVLELNEFGADRIKLTDFGMPPDPVQNAFYLSPEQRLDAHKSDARTDIYALGCIMYEALVGRPPSTTCANSNTALNYLHELANQFSKESPEHNALKLLDCIIIKCLQHDANKRFRNIRELVDALRLVNECICGGKTRKLPPRAENLLLFRFLDCFDKKIVLCMFAYIFLAGISAKFVGETQLQKYIDEAQLAKRAKLPLAQEYWHAAIHQAELIGKPPSLKADLHWELADTLSSQCRDVVGQSINDDLTKEAISEYELAKTYFTRGLHYQSYRLDLLENISNLWMSFSTADAKKVHSEAVLKEARQLLKSKKYEACAALCAELLRSDDDSRIAYCASSAYNELGITLPAEKAIICFQRALYYVNEAGADDLAESKNLNTCMREMHLDPTGDRDNIILARAALERGDAEAFQAQAGQINAYDEALHRLQESMVWYHGAEQATYSHVAHDQNMKMAIAPLQEALKIEEQSYGLHSEALGTTLISLAECYRNAGQDQKAIDSYKRIYSILPKINRETNIFFGTTNSQTMFEYKARSSETLLAFVDLLAKHGRFTEATKVLEQSVLSKGIYDQNHPLFIRLLKAYADDKSDLTDHAAASLLEFNAWLRQISSPSNIGKLSSG